MCLCPYSLYSHSAHCIKISSDIFTGWDLGEKQRTCVSNRQQQSPPPLANSGRHFCCQHCFLKLKPLLLKILLHSHVTVISLLASLSWKGHWEWNLKCSKFYMILLWRYNQSSCVSDSSTPPLSQRECKYKKVCLFIDLYVFVLSLKLKLLKTVAQVKKHATWTQKDQNIIIFSTAGFSDIT